MKIQLNRFEHHAGRDRILSIDSLRGFAMLLVMMQHSYLNVNEKLILPLFAILLWGITGMAAVAFVAISGMMFSYYLSIHDERGLTYRRYTARAAFLILAVHPMINLVSYYFNMIENDDFTLFSSFSGYLLFSFPITDTIGICILMAPIFICCLRPVIRTLVIVTMLAVTPVIVAFMNPTNAGLMIIKEMLFGSLGAPKYFWWPLVPWLAIFLSGSFVGQSLSRMKRGKIDIYVLVNQTVKAGVTLLVCCIVLTLGYIVLKAAFWSEWSADIFRAIYPRQTTALLPGYLGLIFLMLATFIHSIGISGKYNRLFWILSILGRTSLFTFVIQFAVVETTPAMLGFKGVLGPGGFLILFALGSTAVWGLSYLYGRTRGWITENDYALCVNMAKTRLSEN